MTKGKTFGMRRNKRFIFYILSSQKTTWYVFRLCSGKKIQGHKQVMNQINILSSKLHFTFYHLKYHSWTKSSFDLKEQKGRCTRMCKMDPVCLTVVGLAKCTVPLQCHFIAPCAKWKQYLTSLLQFSTPRQSLRFPSNFSFKVQSR